MPAPSRAMKNEVPQADFGLLPPFDIELEAAKLDDTVNQMYNLEPVYGPAYDPFLMSPMLPDLPESLPIELQQQLWPQAYNIPPLPPCSVDTLTSSLAGNYVQDSPFDMDIIPPPGPPFVLDAGLNMMGPNQQQLWDTNIPPPNTPYPAPYPSTLLQRNTPSHPIEQPYNPGLSSTPPTQAEETSYSDSTTVKTPPPKPVLRRLLPRTPISPAQNRPAATKTHTRRGSQESWGGALKRRPADVDASQGLDGVKGIKSPEADQYRVSKPLRKRKK